MLVTEIFLVALVQGKLFEEIAEGLKHARVVIVCASNEVCVILFTSCTVKYTVICLVVLNNIFLESLCNVHCL